MASHNLMDLGLSIARVDISPEDLGCLTLEYEKTLTEPQNEGTLRDRASIVARLGEIRLVRREGEPIKLRALSEQIIRTAGSERLSQLTPENFSLTSPFREIGNVPIAVTDATAEAFGVTRVRHLTHILRHESVADMPLLPEDRAPQGHSFWLRRSHGWWVPIFFIFIIQYWASTEVMADGIDGAPYAGQPWEQAYAIYQAFSQMPPPYAAMGNFWYSMAQSTPKTPFPCYSIGVSVMSGSQSNFSCGHSEKTEYGASYVKDTLTTGSGTCPLAVHSSHEGQLWKGAGNFFSIYN